MFFKFCFLFYSQTELNLSCFVDIEDDEDFCEKLAIEENLVLLPGINQYSLSMSKVLRSISQDNHFFCLIILTNNSYMLCAGLV